MRDGWLGSADGTRLYWQAWGEQDPYYAVLSESRYGRDSIDAHRDAFPELEDKYRDHLEKNRRPDGSLVETWKSTIVTAKKA